MKIRRFKPSKTQFALGTLLLITAAWGLTFPLIKSAVAEMPPLLFVALRFVIAALFLTPLMWTKFRTPLTREELKAGTVLGVLLALGHCCQTAGMRYTSASNAGFITGLCVALVPVIDWENPIRRSAVIGVITAVVGLGMLSLGGDLAMNWGDLLVLICAFGFAAQIVYVGRVAIRFDPIRITWLQLSVCAALSVLAALVLEPTPDSQLQVVLRQPQVWVALAFCSVIATAIAFLVQVSAQRHTTALQAALVFTLEPVFAVFFGFFLIHETLTWFQGAGCILMLAGMIYSEVAE